MGFNWLSVILFLPVVGAIVIALYKGADEKLIKRLAAAFTAVPFILAVMLFIAFNRTTGGVQFEE